MTQWLLACNCEIPPEKGQEQPLCLKCGKRIATGRVGSFTHWIFGSHTCNCGAPVARSKAKSPVARPIEEVPAEPTIPVSPNLFPQDRYRPIQELGEGSSGKVFLCEDEILKKRVAVKSVIKLDSDQIIGFQKEAKALSALNHPNIVKILDFGASDSNAPYMVLDYTPGKSLYALQQSKHRLSWSYVFTVALQLCDALEYAHSRGTFHRDLKPNNVIIEETDGGIKVHLIDFGIAKISNRPNEDHDQTAHSQHTTIAGTPVFMSADQALGKSYDARSEVYSLGCLIYFCITGRPPFLAGTPLELLRMHAEDAPPSITDSVPQDVNTIVQKCLSKEPDDRYQSMSELRSDIAATLQESNAEVPLPEVVQEVLAESQTTSKPATLLVMLPAVLLLTILGASIWYISQLKHEAKPKEFKEIPTFFSGISKSALTLDQLEKRSHGKFIVVSLDKFPVLEGENATDEDLRLLEAQEIHNLRLSNCAITGSGLKYLNNSKLYMLSLSGCPIEDTYLAYLKDCGNIQKLDISGTNVTLEGIKNLKGTKLQTLTCSNCKNFDRKCLQQMLENFPGLSGLCASQTAINGDDFELIAKFRNLRRLELAGIKATPQQFMMLAKAPSLEELWVNNGSFNDAALFAFRDHKRLKAVYAEDCKGITAAGLQKLKKAAPSIAVTTRRKSINDALSKAKKRIDFDWLNDPGIVRSLEKEY